MADIDVDKIMDKAFPATKRANKSVSKEIELVDLDVTPVMNLLWCLSLFLFPWQYSLISQ